ncbi:hypothetical protein [Paenibacillus ihbetae]|nr:hypothetical protein [Paenibacillus ihbetae]
MKPERLPPPPNQQGEGDFTGESTTASALGESFNGAGGMVL